MSSRSNVFVECSLDRIVLEIIDESGEFDDFHLVPRYYPPRIVASGFKVKNE